MTVHIKTTRRSAMMATLLAAFDEGSGPAKLRIYTGPQPANADTAASGTLLLEFVLNDPAWTESGGVLTLDVSPDIEDDALASGTAGWGRFVDSDDEAVVDGSVGAEIALSDTSLDSGQTVSVVSATLTLPA